MNQNFVSKAPQASAVLSSEEGKHLLRIGCQRGSEPWPEAHSDREQAERPYLSPLASVNDSLLHADCAVEAQVTDSILCSGVTIGRDSVVLESVIMPGAIIGRGVKLHRAFIGEGAFIADGAAVVGTGDQMAIVQPGEAVTEKFSFHPVPLHSHHEIVLNT